MDEVLQQIKELTKQMNERFERIDERFERMESRLSSLEESNQVTRDIIKDMELRFDERLGRLEAGQENIRADIARLERNLFIEEGSREHADVVQGEEFRKLEKRVAALEAGRTLVGQVA